MVVCHASVGVFVTTCRSVPAGRQEKLKGRNKLVPRLLGVTKEAVLRLDEKTKEILKDWAADHRPTLGAPVPTRSHSVRNTAAGRTARGKLSR